MMSTAYYSGGEVEHEVGVLLNICQLFDGGLSRLIQLFMIGGVIFIIVEMKLGYEGQDSIAQLLLDLLCRPEFLFLSYAELVYSGCRNEQEYHF
jgi:hypothetical protein